MQLLLANQDMDLSGPWPIAVCLLPFIVVGIGWLTRQRESPRR